MSNRLFSLIYGKPNKIAANKKIIPAADVGQLIEAQEILVKVKDDAEKYKLEVAQQCEKLKENATKEGFAVGYQEWSEHISRLEDEILKVRKELVDTVVPVALKAAQKIVGREITLSEESVVDIICNTLKTVAQNKKITIYVNKKDFAAMERNRPRIKALFENLEALSIREREGLERGDCVIETESGIINAQLENQWSALERAFTALLKKSTSESQPSAKSEKNEHSPK